MRKTIGLIALLFSSAAVLVSPALARDREDCRPNNYGYTNRYGYTNGYGYGNGYYTYNAPSYSYRSYEGARRNDHERHEWLERQRREQRERARDYRNDYDRW